MMNLTNYTVGLGKMMINASIDTLTGSATTTTSFVQYEQSEKDWDFPRSTCETGTSNSQPVSSFFAFGTSALLLYMALFYNKSTVMTKLPWEYKFSLITQIIFEFTHGLCHAKNDIFDGQCYTAQHLIGLPMLYGFILMTDLLCYNNSIDKSKNSNTSNTKHKIGAPLTIITMDITMTVFEVCNLYRTVASLLMFAFFFLRAALSSNVKLSESYHSWGRIAVATTILSYLFYVDGTYCTYLNTTYGQYPYHVLIELVGGYIFYASNCLFQKVLLHTTTTTNITDNTIDGINATSSIMIKKKDI
jgi:hypothetical protein